MRNDGKNVNDASHGKNDVRRGKNTSHPSPSSHDGDRLLPPRGDYRTLLSFQKAEIVYDITFRFAHKFLSKGDRTVDQMIQSGGRGRRTFWRGARRR